MERFPVDGRKQKDSSKKEGLYFKRPAFSFIHTGCTTLDCALGGPGGGWAVGRVINIVGDQAVGKTLLAIEACANFHMQYPKGFIWYREAEGAFDTTYAARVGLPLETVDFGPDGEESLWSTVEDIYEDLESCLAKAERRNQPGVYIIDSLDALTAREEIKRKIDKGSYKTDKAKLLSELFRRDITRRAKRARVSLVFISQVRDRIGIAFGEKKTRSGGKSLNFYSSQIIYLSHLAKMTRTVKGNKRVVGVRVRAKVTKNKIGDPFREVEFVIRFNYGVDDFRACLEWLCENRKLHKSQKERYLEEGQRLEEENYTQFEELLHKWQLTVKQAWEEIEGSFVPPHSKYYNGRKESA